MTGRFVPLSPPPDGLSAVIGEGRRRRRRRAAATSGAAVSALAGLLALAVLAPGGGTDALRPEPVVPAEQPTSTPSPSAPDPSGTPSVPPSPAPATSPSPAATTSPDASPEAGSSAAPSPVPQPSAAGYRTPDLVRTYTGPPSSARLCGAAYSNEGSGGQVGWCVVVTAERTNEGADLVVEVCRDGTTAGRLTYGTEHEVDLAVLEDGVTLWQWSVGRTPADDAHEQTAEPGGCWRWRAPWTGVDQRGESLDGGSYVLRGRSLADQLADVPPKDTTFTL